MVVPTSFVLAVFLVLNGASGSTKSTKLSLSTVIQEPFITASSEGLWGHKGILVDLLDYFIENTPNLKDAKAKFTVFKSYGEKGSDGKWTEVVGDVVNNTETDFGLAVVTVNSERLDAVQFSMPFYTTGLSAVGKGIDFPINTENLPKILKMAQDDKITVGCWKGISDEAFFKNTDIPVYKDMYVQMKKKEENFVHNYEEGLEKVRQSSADKPYVLFGEKSVLEYYAGKKPCDLKVPACESLNTVHYALVFNKNINPNVIRDYNKHIAEFLASGKMEGSKQKWYNNECHVNKTVA